MIAMLSGHYELLICDNCGEVLDRPYKVNGTTSCDRLCEHEAQEEAALEEGLLRTLARG
jgi:hypothetical protein